MSEGFSPDDGLVVMRAEIDQMVAIAPELARAVRGFVDAFTKEGFSEKQALYLTMAQILTNPGTAP